MRLPCRLVLDTMEPTPVAGGILRSGCKIRETQIVCALLSPDPEARLKKLVFVVLAAGLCVAAPACNLGTELTLEVFDLRVVPTQAQPGDAVTFAFTLVVVSSGSVNLTALIDDDVFKEEVVPGYYSNAFEWAMGDAEELIDRYGLGSHTARVNAVDVGSGRTATAGSVTFELVEPTGQ